MDHDEIAAAHAIVAAAAVIEKGQALEHRPDEIAADAHAAAEEAYELYLHMAAHAEADDAHAASHAMTVGRQPPKHIRRKPSNPHPSHGGGGHPHGGGGYRPPFEPPSSGTVPYGGAFGSFGAKGAGARGTGEVPYGSAFGVLAGSGSGGKGARRALHTASHMGAGPSSPQASAPLPFQGARHSSHPVGHGHFPFGSPPSGGGTGVPVLPPLGSGTHLPSGGGGGGWGPHGHGHGHGLGLDFEGGGGWGWGPGPAGLLDVDVNVEMPCPPGMHLEELEDGSVACVPDEGIDDSGIRLCSKPRSEPRTAAADTEEGVAVVTTAATTSMAADSGSSISTTSSHSS